MKLRNQSGHVTTAILVVVLAVTVIVAVRYVSTARSHQTGVAKTSTSQSSARDTNIQGDPDASTAESAADSADSGSLNDSALQDSDVQ